METSNYMLRYVIYKTQFFIYFLGIDMIFLVVSLTFLNVTSSKYSYKVSLYLINDLESESKLLSPLFSSYQHVAIAKVATKAPFFVSAVYSLPFFPSYRPYVMRHTFHVSHY